LTRKHVVPGVGVVVEDVDAGEVGGGSSAGGVTGTLLDGEPGTCLVVTTVFPHEQILAWARPG
jgi:hypothetical protein